MNSKSPIDSSASTDAFAALATSTAKSVGESSIRLAPTAESATSAYTPASVAAFLMRFFGVRAETEITRG